MGAYQSATIEGFDAEALLGVVRDTRFDQRLLARGHFRAQVQRVVFDDFSLDCGAYSLPVFASGTFGPRVMALAIALESREAMWINGRAVQQAELMVFAEDQPVDVRPSAGLWQWAVVLVSRERLQQVAQACLGRELPLPASGWKTHPHWRAQHIATSIRRTLHAASGWDATTATATMRAAGEGLLASCVREMGGAIGPTSLPRPMAPGRDAARLIRRAEALIREHYGTGMASEQLSAALGVGERQVERLFQQAYGMTPQRWQQVARLNMAHQALLHAQPNEHVTDVALRMGFGHLGRFSTRYRDLFGEAPRDTLQRARKVTAVT